MINTCLLHMLLQIGFLLFILLYVISYIILCTFKRRADSDDFYAVDAEDAVVYRVSLWLCTFTLAVSGGAVLLLPLSIIANEALLIFPNSYYLQWIKASLISGLWNSIFLWSNVSLIILMPFAYFFIESQGLPGARKGIMSRLYETAAVLILVAIVVYGLVQVVTALIDSHTGYTNMQSASNFWRFCQLYVYSSISLVGVLMLLIFTPLGFARIFTVMGKLVFKPKFLYDVDGDLSIVQLEEASLQRQLNCAHVDSLSRLPASSENSNGHVSTTELRHRLSDVQKSRQELERNQRASSVRRNIGYPIVMLLLLFLTSLSVLMVALNMVELLVGLKALPVATKEIVLGIASLSALGPFGAAVEIIVILYVMLASVVGFYTLRCCSSMMPRRSDTPMTHIIFNCVVLLVLSSALPVLSRILGITNFDLLGHYGRLEWLGNFYLVLLYNLVFAIATVICLTTKFTASVRTALIDGLLQSARQAVRRIHRSHSLHPPFTRVKDD